MDNLKDYKKGQKISQFTNQNFQDSTLIVFMVGMICEKRLQIW